MERFGLAGFLAVVVPALAVAQRIEVAVFAGGYQPTPSTWNNPNRITIDCGPEDDCRNYYYVARLERGWGMAVGGRFSLEFTPRFGIDATILRAQHTNSQFLAEGRFERVQEDVNATVVALQPHMRFRLDEFLEFAIALGPAVSLVTASSADPSLVTATNSARKIGMALSVGLHARIAPPLALAFRASDYLFLSSGEPSAESRSDLTWGVGLAFAFGR